VAYVVIRQFLVIVARYGLTPFGWYRIAAGLALAAYIWI
jgi:undecaprenyl pyrophosphate phosphatase UppP